MRSATRSLPGRPPQRRQRGVTLFGLLFWAIVVGAGAYVALRVFPTVNEYLTIQRAVNKIAMQVKPGEIYGFLGPNGSGKTTFLRMLCGLLTPDGGSGTCLSFDILKEAMEIKRRVGYMT